MKLLSLITFCLFATISIAQDASNDATWEETIDFIKQNKHHIERSEAINYESKNKISVFDFKNDKLKLSLSGIIAGKNGQYCNSTYLIDHISIDLGQLKKASLYGDYIYLSFIDESVKYLNLREKKSCYWYRGANNFKDRIEKIDDRKKTSISLYLSSNTEMRPRLEKAFEHLAYLATKKREEVRKTSGSKF